MYRRTIVEGRRRTVPRLEIPPVALFGDRERKPPDPARRSTERGRAIKDPEGPHESRSDDGSDPPGAQQGAEHGRGSDWLDTVPLGVRSVFSALVEELGDAPPHVRLQETGEDAVLDVRTVSRGGIPSRIGRYQVVGEIARGGIGVVYRVRDIELGRDAALKVLLDPGNEAACRRFVEEAQIGGQLQHPGIVQVHEIGLLDDQVPFFTMKLVKGQTLAAVLDGRQSVTDERQRLLGIFEQISQTLAYAHARGVIHRDLKPSNIMVGAFGEVQVMDWGFAKVLSEGGVADERRARKTHMDVSVIETIRSEGDGTQSLPGSVMGTPSYMPPEQARGSVEDLDERSDVFGLGAILCEILTGKPPYVGRSSKEVCQQAQTANLADAAERLDRSGADAEIVALAKRCLAPEPRDRHRDAGNVARVMRAYFDSMDKRTRAAELEAAEARVRAKGERRARRLTLAIGAVALLAIVAGGTGFYLLERDRRQRTAAATNAVERAVAEAGSLRSEAQAAADLAKWDRAVGEAERAVSLVTPDVQNEVRTRTIEFRRNVEEGRARARELATRSRRESDLLGELEALRLRHAHAAEDELAKLATAYENPWLRFGLDLRRLEVADAAQRIRATAVADALTRTLDDWSAALRKSASDGGELWRKLLDVALAVDRDRRRSTIRKAVVEEDVETLQRMATEILLRDRFQEEQPPALTFELLNDALFQLGSKVTVQGLATRAHLVHPGDFWIHHRLGQLHADRDPPDLALAHRHYVAAVSLRRRNPHTWFDLGRLLARRGDPDAAVRVLKRALELPGHDPATREYLADALARTGDFSSAVASYREVVEADPGNVQVLGRLADTLVKGQDLEAAVAAYREALKVDAGNADLHHGLGKALEELARGGTERLRDAAAAYRQAANLAPDAADYRLALARVLLELGETEGAELAARKVVEVDPESASAHEILGRSLARSGDLEGAAKAFEEFVRLAPDEAVILTERSGLEPTADEDEIDRRNRAGRAERETGLRVFRKTLERQPGNSRAETHVAIFQMRSGDLEAAVASLRSLQKREGDDALVNGALGLALLLGAREHPDASALEEAAAALEKAVALSPGHAGFRNNLAAVRYEQRRTIEAARELRKAVQANPHDAMAHFNLGQVLSGEKRFAEAVKSYRRATEIDDDNVEYHLGHGHALLEESSYIKALVAFRRALELDPREARALSGLAATLRKLGRLDEALASVRESLQFDSLEARTHNIHGQVLASRGETDGAVDAFRHALRLDRNLSEAAERLGALHLQEEDFPRAVDAFRRAIRADPTRPEPYSQLRALLDRKEGGIEPGDALDDLVRALDDVLAAGGDVRPEAEEVFLVVWSRNPLGGVRTSAVELAKRRVEDSRGKDARSLGLLAQVLFAAGKKKQAVVTLEDAVKVAGLAGSSTTELEEDLERYRAAVLPELLSYRSIDAAIERPETLVAAGASWRYLPGVEEPSPGLEWTGKEFDDGHWQEGPGPFRYGEPGEGTLLEDMIGSYTTLYLRGVFQLRRRERFSRIYLSVKADDSFVAYLNGHEVGRARAGASGVRLAYDARATDSAIEPLEAERVDLPRDILVEGENFLGMQGVNERAADLDFFLTVEVLGELAPGEDEPRFRAYRENPGGENPSLRLAYLDGRLLQRQGRHAEAVEAFRRVLAEGRDQPDPFLRLAESLKASRDTDEAYRTLKEELARGKVPDELLELPPETPRNLRPPPGSTVETPVAILEGTPYFRYGGDAHFRSHWQIRAEEARYERNPTFDGYSERHLSSWMLPRGLLSPGVTYFWRVDYSGQEGQESGFSQETSFRTADFTLNAVRFELAGRFNRDVVVDPGDAENDDVDNGGWALIVDGFDGNRTDNVNANGLPRDRAIRLHRLASYADPNAVQLSKDDDTELRIVAPRGRYTTLLFLATSGNGASSIPLTLEYAGGRFEPATLACPDWFDDPREAPQAGCNPVWNGMDRIALTSGTIEERDDAALFEIPLLLESDRELVAVVLRPGDGQYADSLLTRFNLFSLVGIRADE